MKTYQIEGFNGIICEWEVMPYETEDGKVLTTFPVEYMAQTVLAHWQEFCPGVEFKLVEVG